jgi:AraC-like DNA-binding protein
MTGMKLSIKITTADLAKYEQVKNLILQDITAHYTIADLSARFAVKESKLKAGFKLLYGESIYSYLKQQRLMRAIHLLSTTDDNIRQIALRCGFAHATNFIAAFHKKYKVRPSHYRRSQVISNKVLAGIARPCFTDMLPLVTPQPAESIIRMGAVKISRQA